MHRSDAAVTKSQHHVNCALTFCSGQAIFDGRRSEGGSSYSESVRSTSSRFSRVCDPAGCPRIREISKPYDSGLELLRREGR